MSTSTIRLQLTDTSNQPLVDPNLKVEFASQDGFKFYTASEPATGTSHIDFNLDDTGSRIYQITLMPSRYRIVKFFLNVTEGAVTTRPPVVFPVDPSRVSNIQAPAYAALPADLQDLLSNATIEGFFQNGAPQQQANLYNALPAVLKAALLNFYVKASATLLPDGTSVFKAIQNATPIKLHQDRIFIKVGAGLYEETHESTTFHPVGFTLHETVPPYQLFDSYKTKDKVGNLQLTFSRNGVIGNDYLVDMDIDLSQLPVAHLFEVLDNAITQTLTNPYDVREVLLVAQGLQPLYGFQFADAGSISIAMSAV